MGLELDKDEKSYTFSIGNILDLKDDIELRYGSKISEDNNAALARPTIHGISFDVQPRTVQFGGDFTISKSLPIVDKHLDIAPGGYCIKTYDDKKQKECSCEAELIFEIDSIGSNAKGYGNMDIRIIGYGRTKEKALEDLDKAYLHALNKFLLVNKI